eukprot:9026004-Alexandrium_andersonii.AAC.1
MVGGSWLSRGGGGSGDVLAPGVVSVRGTLGHGLGVAGWALLGRGLLRRVSAGLLSGSGGKVAPGASGRCGG